MEQSEAKAHIIVTGPARELASWFVVEKSHKGPHSLAGVAFGALASLTGYEELTLTLEQTGLPDYYCYRIEPPISRKRAGELAEMMLERSETVSVITFNTPTRPEDFFASPEPSQSADQEKGS